MIRPQDVRMDLRALHFLLQSVGYQYVVDSPSDVARARIREVAPPRIVAVALGEDAERVDEPGVDEILEARAFFVRESLLAAIRLGIREIVFGVRDVEI